MRILILNPWGPASGYGGPGVLLNRLFECLVRMHPDVEVDILCREDSPVPVSHAHWARETHVVRIASRTSNFSRWSQVSWILKASLFLFHRVDTYDLIHVHGAYASNLIPLLALRKKTGYAILPVLENGDLRPAFGVRRPYGTLRRRLVADGSIWFALSKGIGSEFVDQGVQPSHIVNLPNVVDVSVFTAKGRTHPQSEGRPFVLGFAGKLGVIKRPHLVVQALDELVQLGYDVQATFVGPFESETYKLDFERDVQLCGLSSRVTTTGYTDNVASYMNGKFDAFVLPSSSEGLPGALVEAMACGLPSIVTDAGGMRDVVDSAGSGFVVDGSPSAIADAIRKLVDEPLLWLEMSMAARRFAEDNFSTEVVVGVYYWAIVDALNLSPQK